MGWVETSAVTIDFVIRAAQYNGTISVISLSIYPSILIVMGGFIIVSARR